MFDKIISYSVKNKFIIGIMVVALTFWGIVSLRQIPIDAVPDITNNQVQIITNTPTLATQEVEQFITTPIELSLQTLQNIEEIRSISKFGLSVVTVVFEEHFDIYLGRQLINERLIQAQGSIPDGLGTPELAPISTGLGEIYQYALIPDEGFEKQYSPTELRTIQDWIVKRQLSGIEGVAEVNSMGGFLKQYEIAIDPNFLKSINISVKDIYEALAKSNENTGGAYIEKTTNTYYIRSEGLVKSLEDIENIVIPTASVPPLLIKDVATVQFGKAPRYGAMVMNGKEVVGGKVMMFKGANSAQVTELIKKRVIQVQKSLPEGVKIVPYLVRDKLINTAIGTVKTNLIEGGLIVVFILVLLLGNWRAGLIVASVIPLAMLFTISMMNLLGISANLMSLGAIDFGLIVDGAVIIVEAIIHRIKHQNVGMRISQEEMDNQVIDSSQKIRSSAAFGEIIILMVYIPILALVGIEGKMFKPMAQTVMLAIGGALILSLTYVPMMVSLFLSKKITNKRTISDRIIDFLQQGYRPILNLALRFKFIFVLITLVVFSISVFNFSRLGGEFIPTLDEGDLAMVQVITQGSSLKQSVIMTKKVQKKLLNDFPEIIDVVSNTGSAEIPTDPMPVEITDYVIIMKPKEEWTSAHSKLEMFEKFTKSLNEIPGLGLEFAQPIQLRFNELMTGSKADIAIKLYGEDLNLMYAKAKEVEQLIKNIEGVASTNVEQTVGLPQIVIDYNYDQLAKYGLHVKEVNTFVRTAFAGEKAGVVYEGEKRFDMVVRMDERFRTSIEDVKGLFIALDNGAQITLEDVANVALVNAPMQISRENTNRRITIGVNVGDIDVATLVQNIQDKLDTQITLPSGYYFTYGGQFENLQAAQQRLGIALPIALAMIFILLFFTFNSISQAALIFTAIPLSAIGGVFALQIRDLPFSISAGIGFIALFGVAVLNGIVLIGYFNQLKKEGINDIKERVLLGTKTRLRPVLMTAAVASLGFLPMAFSNSGGAEVQRPLATVVIGGLFTATFLTLVILPILYIWVEKFQNRKYKNRNIIAMFILIGLTALENTNYAQSTTLSMDSAVQLSIQSHPSIEYNDFKIEQFKSLQGMKYNPGNTDIGYQGDGLFTPNGQTVNQIGIVQNFKNPKVTKSTNLYQDELVTSSQIDKQISIKELTLNVSYLYQEILYQKEINKRYNKLINTYSNYYEIAVNRVEIGVANGLEQLSIQSQLDKYKLARKQTLLKIASLETQFQNLVSMEGVTTIDTLTLLSNNTSGIANIWEAQASQQTKIAEAKIEMIKAAAKPEFNVGYAAQNYYQGGFYSGLQVGVSLPLFKSQTKQKVNAQKISIEAFNTKKEALVKNYANKTTEALNAILTYQEGAKYYKNQLQTTNAEISRIAHLNYVAGTLSYLELLNALNIESQNKMNYLEQIVRHNKSVLYYQFLTNK